MGMQKIRSRINQFISKELMVDLNKVCNNVVVSDNNIKATKIKQLLDEHDVYYHELGPGTNRIAVLIDGYVFKIAMDKWGKQDNANEFAMSKELQPFVIKVYECNDLISVSEYVTLITREEFREKKSQILKVLSILSESYLLGDVGYVEKNFTNWGYRDNGELVILDFAYIHNIHGEELFCPNDRTMIEYDVNFDKLRCPTCNKRFTFMDIRKKISLEEEWEFINAYKNASYILTEPELIINTKEQEVNIQKEETVMEEREVFTEEVIEESYKNALQRLRAMRDGQDVAPIVQPVTEIEEPEEVDSEGGGCDDDQEEGIDLYDAFRQANRDKNIVDPSEPVEEVEPTDEDDEEEEVEENDGPLSLEEIIDNLDENNPLASEPVFSTAQQAGAVILTGSANVDTVRSTETSIEITPDETVRVTGTETVSKTVELSKDEAENLLTPQSQPKQEAYVPAISFEEDDPAETPVEETEQNEVAEQEQPNVEEEVVEQVVVEEKKIEVSPTQVIEKSVEEKQTIQQVRLTTPEQTSDKPSIINTADLMARAHQQQVSTRRNSTIRVSRPAPTESEEEKYERLAREQGFEID